MTFTAELRWVLMLVSLVLIGLAYVAMVVVSWRHHRRGSPSAPNFHGSLLVEVCWILAPILIVLALVWPTVQQFLRH